MFSMLLLSFGPFELVAAWFALRASGKARVTYCVTDQRLLKVTSSLFWFPTRVYCFPLSRITELHVTIFDGTVSRRATKGRVMWRDVPFEESFSDFLYMEDAKSVVRLLLERKRLLSKETIDMRHANEATVIGTSASRACAVIPVPLMMFFYVLFPTLWVVFFSVVFGVLLFGIAHISYNISYGQLDSSYTRYYLAKGVLASA